MEMQLIVSYMLIVYPVTLINSLISSRGCEGRFLGIFYINNHVIYKYSQIFFFLSNLYAFYFLLLLYCANQNL